MDILQDAAVTTLEKLCAGAVADPSLLGGYLYRVALNHVRNYQRRDRSARSDLDAIDRLEVPEDTMAIEDLRRKLWAAAAMRLLQDFPNPRDREILVRFYLHEDARPDICRDFGITTRHFDRVIARARRRFREFLERKGFDRADLLSTVLATVCLAILAAGHGATVPPTGVATPAPSVLLPASSWATL